MNRLGAAALLAAIAATPGVAQTASAPVSATVSHQLSPQDRQFLNFAAQDNQAEIRLCLLAERKTTAPVVNALARLMVDDHVEIESRLTALIDVENVETPSGIGAEHEAMEAKLSSVVATGFDRAFLDAQMRAHAEDVKRFGEEKARTQNPEIRQYVAETIPILEQHLTLARSLLSALSQRHAQAPRPISSRPQR